MKIKNLWNHHLVLRNVKTGGPTVVLSGFRITLVRSGFTCSARRIKIIRPRVSSGHGHGSEPRVLTAVLTDQKKGRTNGTQKLVWFGGLKNLLVGGKRIWRFFLEEIFENALIYKEIYWRHLATLYFRTGRNWRLEVKGADNSIRENFGNRPKQGKIDVQKEQKANVSMKYLAAYQLLNTNIKWVHIVGSREFNHPKW